MRSDADVITFHVTFGTPGDNTFDLRFPVQYTDEILSLLDRSEIEYASNPKISADVVLAMEAVKVLGSAGGIQALSSLIEAFLQLHHGNRIALKLGDTEMETAGLSVDETEPILQAMAVEQAQMDTEWFKQVEKRSNDTGD